MRVDLCLNPKQFNLTEARELIPSVRQLLCRHDTLAAYLFGSTLRNETNALSDLDIAVLPPAALSDWLGYYTALYGALCKLFRADNIDLVLLDRAPLGLQARVVIEGQRLLDTPHAVDFEDHVLTRYSDLAAWRAENWQAVWQDGEVSMIDRSRVVRFVSLVREYDKELRALKLDAMGFENYRDDKRTCALSEHYLRLVIEATLDLGRHVLVKSGLGVPEDYRDVGKMLREKGVVPYALGRTLERMAGMRNVLVHLYWDIDHTIIYQTVTTELDTFEQFLTHIHRYLDKGAGSTDG